MSPNPPGGPHWEVLEEIIYETFPIFRLRRSTRQHRLRQQRMDFFLLDGLDWTNVIARTARNQIVMVRQFRHGCEDFTLEIPGGVVESGETPAQAVQREFQEETGYRFDTATLLGVIHPNPAFQSLRCHCYVADNAQLNGPQMLDPGEDIEVQLMDQSEVFRAVRQGQITHAIVLAALGLYTLHRQSGDLSL